MHRGGRLTVRSGLHRLGEADAGGSLGGRGGLVQRQKANRALCVSAIGFQGSDRFVEFRCGVSREVGGLQAKQLQVTGCLK